MRFTGTKEQSQKYVKTIMANTPDDGDICLLFFTDKQFSQIVHLNNLEQGQLSEGMS